MGEVDRPDGQSSPLVKAVASILDVMTEGERAAVARHLAAFNVTLPRASDLLRCVRDLFQPGVVMAVEDIVAEARKHEPSASRQQVSNSLAYLTRRKAIRRVRHGHYGALLARAEAPSTSAGGKDA